MKILGTGLTGLVGSRIVELLKNKHEFENASTSSGIDILNKDNLINFFNSSDASTVIHLAAKADVDGCEQDKEEDLRISSLPIKKQAEEFGNRKSAWAVNVLGTQNVVDACIALNKKLIYISTDFIFDGEKDFYTEEDSPNPINWYGKTKYEGEKLAMNPKIPWTVLRISYPYRATFSKKDFVRAIVGLLKNGEKVRAITDQIITPTFIDDLASVFDYFIQNNIGGIYNATGSNSLSPYEIAGKICRDLSLDRNLIEKTTGEEFFLGRAKRPSHLSLKNDKIRKLGISMKSFEEGLGIIKKDLI